MIDLLQKAFELLNKGGPALWLLLLLSVIGMAVVIERCWFWIATNNAGRLDRVARMGKLLRAGNRQGARVLADADGSIYGRVVLQLLDEQVTEASALASVEMQRPALERFMPLLSTLITGAPLLGLVGTVLGLIHTFQFMSDQKMSANPANVSLGLSEALLNTAGGLLVALLVLFPYNAFRAQIDRTLGRIEGLVAAAAGVAAGSPSAGENPCPPAR